MFGIGGFRLINNPIDGLRAHVAGQPVERNGDSTLDTGQQLSRVWLGPHKGGEADGQD
jgi:hypothetical protein